MEDKDFKQEQNPLISVITPAYNAEEFIKGTIESVLAQTYSNWEMIIVDDYSSDRTVEFVKTYEEQDTRIKLVELEENSGSAIARNTAMENASGRYIAFLDSDDLWFSEKLEKQLHFMQKKDIAFSFTKYVRMEEDGTLRDTVSKAPESVGYDDLMKHCVIGCLTVMIDRDKVGHQKMVNIRTRQDYAYWLAITKKGFRAYGLPEVLSKYRTVENSISSNKIKAAKRQWYVYRQIEHQNLLKSLWYFLHYAAKGVQNLIKFKLSTRSS
ncbi:teichuronic acid biosynthesis glycosyltransferase TuaG [Lentibacillus halodurans]|uniref:Teichuronic acid biosynthesis glycosyltransferase TuaG n=1 Tax=Lentibacillus halodurans TaxID=237679 RepID=A0A1I0ZND1_9BACI|nr:glycosyltransferase family 2 protein [Lentibacillus halodurans]SFB27309.1 teichuronic acid biosynthesis glycosyltransferase TuaG [Lentibacillus halodurans]